MTNVRKGHCFSKQKQMTSLKFLLKSFIPASSDFVLMIPIPRVLPGRGFVGTTSLLSFSPFLCRPWCMLLKTVPGITADNRGVCSRPCPSSFLQQETNSEPLSRLWSPWPASLSGTHTCPHQTVSWLRSNLYSARSYSARKVFCSSCCNVQEEYFLR